MTTRQYTNEQADNLITSDRYVPVTVETSNAPVTENMETPVDTTVVENTENSTEVLNNPSGSAIVEETESEAGELSYNDFTLDKTKHTQTGEDIWVIRPIERVENFKELQAKMKSLGGYYSRFANTPHGKGGFVFKTAPSNLFVETQEVTNNVRGEEISDTVNTESTKEVERNVSNGEGVTQQSVQGKITEILLKSSTNRNSDEIIGNGTGRIEQKKTEVKTQEVKTDGSVEGYDSIGETQLRKVDKEGVHPQGSNTDVAENTSNSERGQRRVDRSNSEEPGEIRQGLIRNVFYGTPYNFTNHEKSYVDLGIHFGTEEQAKTRLSNGQGNILQRDLQLKNPLITQRSCYYV